MTVIVRANRPGQPFVPPRYYAVLVDVLVALGHDRSTILHTVRLESSLLASDGRYLTLAQVEALVGHACRLENTDDLGLRVGQRLQLMSHGALSVAALTAPSPRAALQTIVEFFPLIMPLFSIRIDSQGESTDVRLNARFPLDPDVERFHTATMSGSLYAQLCFLIGGPMPSGVELFARHPRPEGLPSWVDDIGVALHFDQPHYAIRVPTRLLEIAMPLADPRTHELGLQSCRDALDAMPDPTLLSSAVSLALQQHGPPFPNVDTVARSLSVSSRSLRRKLDEEGTSFRELLEDVRLALADEWLRDPGRSITDIGISLGYADASNFSRAYRRARGKSASQARTELQDENAHTKQGLGQK
ncbi:MAG: AraC family transcriptional regulator ligand-binding domain-containing protein [Myxococcales bacterium]|nr:AraC family transcriptional regulator ligand-binding domain-containing protein [Myxococcales bacterium]